MSFKTLNENGGQTQWGETMVETPVGYWAKL